MKAGDLVKVTTEGLRVSVGSLGVITRVEEREDSHGTMVPVTYWAQMVESGHSFWFRPEYLEVISESR